MRSLVISLLVLGLVSAASDVLAAEWADNLIRKREHDFGHLPRGATAEHTFVLTNNLAEVLEIKEVRASCGCLHPTCEKQTVGPGETTAVKVVFDAKSAVGRKSGTVTVVLIRPQPAEVVLTASGLVLSDLEVSPSRFDFGVVEEGTVAIAKVTATHVGDAAWAIEAAEGGSRYVSVRCLVGQRQVCRC